MTSTPTIFVPAYGVGAGFWAPVLSAWSGANEVHVLAGFGVSETLPSFDEHVEGLRLAAERGDRPAALVGHCASTKIVAAAAVVARDAVSHVVLLCPNFAPTANDSEMVAPLGRSLLDLARAVRRRPRILRIAERMRAEIDGDELPGYIPSDIVGVTVLGAERNVDAAERYYRAVADYYDVSWPDAASRIHHTTAVVALADAYVDPVLDDDDARVDRQVLLATDDHFFPYRQPALALEILDQARDASK